MNNKTTILTLQQMKQGNKKIACLTAYDASFATILDEHDVDLILVGDSLGMVIKGDENTIAVTVDDVVYHTKNVKAGIQRSFLLADLPFMSYSTPEHAFINAERLMRAGAQMVKLEGGAWLADTVNGLVERGIPVCGHLGLTPQSVHVLGGFNIQARKQRQAEQLIKEAKIIEQAGAQLLVLECVPSNLAQQVTNTLTIPVIGIGSGPVTDGQILVFYDILGISKGLLPKFSKNFLLAAENEDKSISGVVSCYVQQVKQGLFPSAIVK